MRLIIILSFALIVQVYAANGYAQSQESNIELKNVPVRDALERIEKETGYTFLFAEHTLDTRRTVSLTFRAGKIKEALEDLFGELHVDYRIVDRQVILSPRRPTSLPQQDPLRRLSGTVTDPHGEPIIGANVLEKGTTNGAVTDIDGKFTLSVRSGAILQVSYIGYVSLEVQVNNSSNLSISLREDSQLLNEVVVVGYGTQKKVNLTGALSTMNAGELENRPITQATQALQGIQGVYVNQAGGQPGADGATIRIRGQGTLNNNNPLILVDGIEYELNAINPNDIENITVLKDAASAAIYGSRAANGVILVTTKKGKKDDFRVDYNNFFGFQQATYLPNFVYDPVLFMEMRNQAQINEGKLVVDYPQATIEEYREGMKKDPYMYPTNNWLDIMFNDAFMMEHNLRFSGGSDKYNYSLSVGYGTQDGVLRGTDAEKYTIGMTSSAQMNSRLRVGINIHGLYRIVSQPVAGVANLVEMTYKAQAFHPTYLEDGRYADTFIRTPGHNIYRHPLALADEGENQQKRMRILTNLHAVYELPFDIVYNLNIGITKHDMLTSRFAPDIYEYQVKTQAPVRVVYDGVNTRHTRKTDDNDMNKTLFNTLTWNKLFQDTHDVKLLVGYSYEDFVTSNFYGQREGYLGNELHELAAGSSNPTVGGTSQKNILMSYFGRANYNFNERYLVEVNFRYDGSSRFAKGNRWGLFPSFSAGWRLSEEAFMKNINGLDNLKVRASWGQLGNERIDMFRYVDLISLGENYPFNGSVSSGAAVTAYNDPNITWETTTMTNIGLDAVVLKGKFDFTFELFNKRTSNILREVVLPQQVGSLAGPIRNIGTVNNRGYELGLKYRDKINDFRYEVYGNLTYVKNKIVDLKDQTIIDGRHILEEGYPIDSYYMLHAIGIFQSQEEIDNSPFQTSATKPGYLKFEDTNKDGKITESDRQILGGVIPEFTYSFGLNLSYKNFDLTTFFQGVTNVYTYGDRIGATPLWFGCGLPERWLTDAWTPERGTSATLPILTTYEGALNENFRVNDFWLRDASYLRLKNIQLTYSLPNHLLKKTTFRNLKFFVNGQNLFTFSPMKEFDPEKNLKGDTFYAFPSVKTFTGGINVTF
ncbi:MAG: TonB-dependent receptor [Tannerellaceae bacterium]|nr:TonB-dependent receptor [Tannerellaceae bacterium]